MSPSTPRPRTITRLGALLVGVITAGLVGLPAAHATDPATVNLVLLPGQSAPIGTLVSNTDVTPVPTCDPELSITFDATMAGTVHVAPDATVGSYTCSVDFQIDGQSSGLIEHVLVDVVPGLSINDVTVAEGNPTIVPLSADISPSNCCPISPGGLYTVASFTVTMSAPSPTTVTVTATTADGTATTTDSDYLSDDTTVTFSPGTTSAVVTEAVVKDTVREPDETFTVNLSAPTNALITDGQGMCTIFNDDTGKLGG